MPSINLFGKLRVFATAAGLIAAATTGSAVSAQTTEDHVSEKEGDLSAAGFIVKPANTPQRVEMLNRLPKKKIVQRVNGDVIHYVYADPKGCNCLYVGDQAAFAKYNQQMQQQMTAETYADSRWNWGAWGGFGRGFGYNGFGW